MDSITHALYRAVSRADVDQRAATPAERRETLGAAVPDSRAGLQPLAVRPNVHDGYAGASGTDLHITLPRTPETLALFLEFTAMGLNPPVSLIEGEAEVILAPGDISVFAPQDNAAGIWCGQLQSAKGGRRTEWKEQVL